MMTEQLRPSGLNGSPRTPEAVLFRLLPALAAAPDDAGALRLALEAITSVVPCEQAFFHAWDSHAAQPQWRCSAATDPGFFNDYVARFRLIDPLASETVQQRCLRENRSLASDEVIAPAALRRTPFHLRFLSCHGDLLHVLCRYAATGEHQRTGLLLFRRADQVPFSRQERELIDLFHDQIAIPLRLRCALTQARRERDALRAGMDLVNQPLFLLDARARVIACNRAADRLAREGRQVRIVNGQLQPGRLMDHASWVPAAIARLRHHAERAHLEALPNRRRNGPPQHYGILSLLDPRGAGSDATALLTLVDRRQPAPRHTIEELCRALGFTCAEARIADALMAGMGTEDISNIFLIRRDTVRSHVKRLLAKTGTQGHADLQKLLLRLSPNFVTLRQKAVTSASQ